MPKLIQTTLALFIGLALLAVPALAENGRGDKKLKRMQANLGLSQQQVDQLKSIFESHHQKVKPQREAFHASLTAEQQAKLKEMKASRKDQGRRHRKGQNKNLDHLNLTAEQQTQWEQLRQTMKAERERMQADIDSVLTPEQQQKRSERRSKRGHQS